MKKLCNNQSGTSKSSVPTSYRGRNHAKKCKNTSKQSQPSTTDIFDHRWSIKELNQGFRSGTMRLCNKLICNIWGHHLLPSSIEKEIRRNRGPNQSHNTFSYH